MTTDQVNMLKGAVNMLYLYLDGLTLDPLLSYEQRAVYYEPLRRARQIVNWMAKIDGKPEHGTLAFELVKP